MESPTYIGLSRQMVLARQMDVIAHNIANANTPAYNSEKMVFVDYLMQPQRKEPMNFVQDYGTYRDVSEGPMSPTGNPLDVAISGEGYFSVQTPQGVRYTRHGRFMLNTENQIVNGQGLPILNAGGSPIAVPAGERVTIAADGTVSTPAGAIGRIGVVTFADQQKMAREANGLYSAEGQPTQPAEKATLLQGMLEQSNVEAIVEMTRMIDVSRSYESASRFLTSEHERQLRAIRAMGRDQQG
ncbi:MAG: flagellar basal-body rod protein FlgF [Alphaproteobacteria bacterium]